MSSAPHFDAPETSELCELLPAYDVQAFIAKGGMGAVYMASQKSLDRPVAIKILPREFGRDNDFRARFEAEAKAMAKLNHPNLIGVYDFGEVDDMPYIVMEYVAGKSLHDSAHGKAIEQTEAGRLALGICEGLAHAHEADILHRDIKPANILLDAKARPKIGDFGLARAVESDESHELVFGTPGYTAPEVMKDPALVGKRSDVFSTGVILYELLTGELPGQKYIPASQKLKVDPRFDRIIRRATHPSPTLRYADGAAMAAELRTLLEALGKPSAASIITQAPATAPRTMQTEEDTEAAAAGEQRRPEPAVVSAAPDSNWGFLRNLVIIAILSVAIYGMWKAYKWKQADIAEQQEAHRIAEEEKARLRAAELEKNRPVTPLDTTPPANAGTDTPTPNGNGTTKPVDPPAMVDPPEPETPAEALARLKPDLVGGDRSEFPPGTQERGSMRYFFIDNPMSWPQANNFAEQHGGHLATCPSEADSNWLATKIPDNATVWLGGGATGRASWGWIDGSEWSHRQLSTSTGTSATLSALGTLKSRPPGEVMPFVIQWQMDGRNDGSLASQLQRTRETLESPNPDYPAGTISFESRRYLLVTRKSSWDDAYQLAQLGNGTLAVPSDEAEIDFLKKLVDDALPAGNAAWIGGQHNERSWAWTTGEPWALAVWAPNSPDGNPESDSALRLVAGPQGGWDDAKPTDLAAANSLLIEWSNDATVDRAVTVPTASGELARVRKIGADAVAAKRAAYLKELKDNGKSLKWDLDFWLRGMAEGPKAQFKPGVNLIKEHIRDDGSIPSDTPRVRLPAEGVRILDGYLDKQNRIHEKFLQEIERLRLSYIGRLRESRVDLEQRGLNSQVQALDNEIAACGTDATALLDHFTGEKHVDPSTESGEL